MRMPDVEAATFSDISCWQKNHDKEAQSHGDLGTKGDARMVDVSAKSAQRASRDAEVRDADERGGFERLL